MRSHKIVGLINHLNYFIFDLRSPLSTGMNFALGSIFLIVTNLTAATELLYAKQQSTFGNKDPGTLIIGTVLPHTGSQAAYGAEAKAGIDLALETIRKEKPDLSRRIELLHFDDKSTPAGAKHAALNLEEKRVNLIIGSVTTPSSHALAELAETIQKPLIVPASSGLNIGPTSSYVFRSCFVDSWQGNILSSFTRDHLHASKAAVYFDPSDPYAKSIAEQFVLSFKKMKGTILSVTSDDNKNKNLHHAIKTWLKNPPEVIIFPSKDYRDAIKLTNELQKSKLNIPVIGGDRWHPSRSNLSKMAKTSDLYFTSTFSWNDQDPGVREFVSAFKVKMRRYPSALAAMTYDAMILAVDSFARAKTTSPDELRRELLRTRGLPALLGPMNINSKGLAEKTTLVMRGNHAGLELKTRVQPKAAIF